MTHPDSRLNRIVVVGASLAGLNAVRELRRRGYPHEIVLIGAERHLPYDRPPLSKQVLTGEWGADRAALLDETEADLLRIRRYLSVTATGLDTDARQVQLSDGRLVKYDGLVVATGCHPVQLPFAANIDGVVTLRTIEDSLDIYARSGAGAKVAVVGAGFIGLEVAASCRSRGADVTVIDIAPVPLGGRFGPPLSDALVTMHKEQGIDLRFGETVGSIEAIDGLVSGLQLVSGLRLPADLVVVGVGVRPAVNWLAGSGLTICDGVVCDEACFAAPDVVAAGDVARWTNRRVGESMRIEHWTNAAEQGRAAAANLLAGRDAARPYEPVPYFWSDQYRRRTQFAGFLRPDADQVTAGGLDRFVTLTGCGERFDAVIGFGWPAAFTRMRRMLVDRVAFPEAVKALRTS
jgi:NADPH-dependent 2,4-dienoyl-CoA reductase/sulfur reductase-like enzyme